MTSRRKRFAGLGLAAAVVAGLLVSVSSAPEGTPSKQVNEDPSPAPASVGGVSTRAAVEGPWALETDASEQAAGPVEADDRLLEARDDLERVRAQLREQGADPGVLAALDRHAARLDEAL